MIFFFLGCSNLISVVFSFRDATKICVMYEDKKQCAISDNTKSVSDELSTSILWTFTDIRMGRQKWFFEIQDCRGDILVDVQASWKNQIQEFSGQCSERIHGYQLKSIQSGVYTIGKNQTTEQLELADNDEISHEVEIQNAFVIGTTEVTQDLYQKVMGDNPAALDVNNCSRVGNKSPPNLKEPVYCVDWYEALGFTNALSKQEGYEPCYTILTQSAVWKGNCRGYRLPTESEWEIAAAQTSIAHAWTIDNSEGRTHEVAQFSPNPNGLYDMLGNVWEWTWDGYGPYPKERIQDPKGMEHSGYRVMRGGTWAKGKDKARISDRANFHPAFRMDVTGLRLVRTLQEKESKSGEK
jgi:formylglycine-generating enzyme